MIRGEKNDVGRRLVSQHCREAGAALLTSSGVSRPVKGRSTPRRRVTDFRTLAVRALLIFTLLTVVSACGKGPDRLLRALQSDPMASATFDGTTLATESLKRTDVSLGKPVYAKVTRIFHLSGEPEQAFDDAANQAREADWSETNSRSGSLAASKTIDGVRAQLSILLAEYEGEQALYVYITSRDH